MPFTRVAGFFGLAMLGIVTYLVASYAVGAGQDRRAGHEQGTVMEVAAPGSDGRPASQIAVPARQFQTAEADLEITRLVPNAGGIVINARAKLWNKTRNQRFVWSLSVYPRGDYEPIWTDRYDHQIGFGPRGNIVRPTFQERLALPPGEYTVSVAIHEVPPEGVDALEDDEVAIRYVLSSTDRHVIVP